MTGLGESPPLHPQTRILTGQVIVPSEVEFGWRSPAVDETLPPYISRQAPVLPTFPTERECEDFSKTRCFFGCASHVPFLLLSRMDRSCVPEQRHAYPYPRGPAHWNAYVLWTWFTEKPWPWFVENPCDPPTRPPPSLLSRAPPFAGEPRRGEATLGAGPSHPSERARGGACGYGSLFENAEGIERQPRVGNVGGL